MTWSLVQTITTSAVSSNKTELRPPFAYFFDTFLPTRGWTVTAGETGGASFSSTAEETWGISKNFTFADGTTLTRNLIVEFEYTSQDVNVYGWDGTPGGGIGSSKLVDTSWTRGMATGANNHYILASDENDDSFCMISGRALTAWSHSSAGIFHQSTDASKLDKLGPILCSDDGTSGYATIDSTYIGAGLASSFAANSYLVTPAFLYFNSNDSGAWGFNTNTDILFRATNTNKAYNHVSGLSPSSALIDGNYYLDLNPAQTRGIMLNTGATDLGVLV